MSNTNNGFADEKNEHDVDDEQSSREPEHTGTVFGSLNPDEGESTSIGTGSSDQGIDPGDIEKESEFGKDINYSSPGAGFEDRTNEDGGQRGNSGGPIGNLAGKYDTNSSSAGGSGTMEKNTSGNKGKNKKPDHGLVEEGPGPDA